METWLTVGPTPHCCALQWGDRTTEAPKDRFTYSGLRGKTGFEKQLDYNWRKLSFRRAPAAEKQLELSLGWEVLGRTIVYVPNTHWYCRWEQVWAHSQAPDISKVAPQSFLHPKAPSRDPAIPTRGAPGQWALRLHLPTGLLPLTALSAQLHSTHWDFPQTTPLVPVACTLVGTHWDSPGLCPLVPSCPAEHTVASTLWNSLGTCPLACSQLANTAGTCSLPRDRCYTRPPSSRLGEGAISPNSCK